MEDVNKTIITEDKEEVNLNPTYPEFEHNATKMEYRKSASFSDEFVIRRAKIYQSVGPHDDRLQCMPIPEFMGLDEAEMENLPKYPPFVKGTVIQGLSIKEDGKEKAEDVWLLCTPDFQVGYVLGKANAFGENTDKKYPWSYNYKSIKSFINARRCLPEDFDYNHLDVVHWVSSDKGGMIECYNYITGDWVLLNTSGSIITVQQKKIYIRVGTPPSPLSAGPVGFSAITMTSDKVHVKSPNIELDGIQVILGHHGQQVAMMPIGSTVQGSNGPSCIPAENVSI